jgi:hypothetical protein
MQIPLEDVRRTKSVVLLVFKHEPAGALVDVTAEKLCSGRVQLDDTLRVGGLEPIFLTPRVVLLDDGKAAAIVEDVLDAQTEQFSTRRSGSGLILQNYQELTLFATLALQRIRNSFLALFENSKFPFGLGILPRPFVGLAQ